MKKYILLIIAATGISAALCTITAQSTNALQNLPVHRFYNFKNNSHFYTINQAEATHVSDHLYGTYRYEGVGFNSSTEPGYLTVAVGRFYDAKNGFHFYSTTNEVAHIPHYRNEGIAFHSVAAGTFHSTPPRAKVNRFYNTQNGAHFYTSNESEIVYLKNNLSSVYRFEGDPFFAF